MIYFKKCGDYISKSYVTIDIDNLKNVREEVINNCSGIIHHEHVCNISEIENRLVGIDYKNLEKEKIDDVTYKIIYDEYKYPRLVELIDKLLSGDSSVISEIASPKETNQNYYDENIEKLNDEINTINNFSTDVKIRKLIELRKLIIEAEINRKRKNIAKYYEMVKTLITVHHIEDISLNTIEMVEKFFDISIDDVIKVKK